MLMTYTMSSMFIFTAPILKWPLSTRLMCLYFIPQVPTVCLLFIACTRRDPTPGSSSEEDKQGEEQAHPEGIKENS